ncbi:hypothetical protein ACFLQ0_02205 [Nitrospinota bacterium]
MNGKSLQAALSAWWDFRCQRYLERSFGRVEEEIRPMLTELLFPPAAEPTLPEQTLPLSFVHIRLLGGEPLPVVQGRLDLLGRLFGVHGAKPAIGTIYLMLTSLTSTPGKLSSRAQAQSAFFSLLLRRIAGMLDRGMSEDDLRRELAEAWDIHGDEATDAVLRGARGYWRRLRDPQVGMASLPFAPGDWLAENGLGEEMASARRLFPLAAGHRHLEALSERLAGVEALRAAIDESEGEVRSARERTLAAIQESLVGGLDGITPWEAETLRPSQPLITSLVEWSGRLQLLGGGETPTAYAGRARLPDWLSGILEATPPGKGVGAAERFVVGGDTYLVFGVDSAAPAEAVSCALAPPVGDKREGVSLQIRFGDGSERGFRFDLSDGKDLLSAVRLAHQTDIRTDTFVRGEDGVWRFGTSHYLLPEVEQRSAWIRMVLKYLFEKFGGEEDRIRLAILEGVKG